MIPNTTFSHKFSSLRLTALALALAALFAGPASAVRADDANDRPLGDSRVLAPFPANPGYPEGIAVNDQTRSLLVTNHAIFFPNPGPLFAVFDVYVGDKASKLERPHIR